MLDHLRYCEWLESANNDLLWISADPGCGKSVLSKSLVDQWLKSNVSTSTIDSAGNKPYIVCYFFFKDNEEQSSLSTALCAILHQLFCCQPELIRHALPVFDRNKEERLTNDVDELWRILQSAIADTSARPVICVLDALDECCDKDRQLLVNLLCQFYRGSIASSKPQGYLKWLVTSRPTDDIQGYFGRLPPDLPSIRLRGEDENDQIRDEIDLVIDQRMNELGRQLQLSDVKREEVTQQLHNMGNRTYLWLYLVLENIEVIFKRSPRPNQVTIPLLPATVNQAYENILQRIVDPEEKQYAKMVLTIIVGAARPLSVDEMALAFDVGTLPEPPHSLDELTVDASGFGDKIRRWCGLFVFIKHNQLYLIHQTAKEFLLSRNDEPVVSSDCWKHCLRPLGVYKEMAKICVSFLCLSEFDTEAKHTTKLYFNEQNQWSPVDSRCGVHHGDDRPGVGTFFDFAAEQWADYVRNVEADLDDQSQCAIRTLYDQKSQRFRRWTTRWMSAKMSQHIHYEIFKLDDIFLASFNGHCLSLQHFLSMTPSRVNEVSWDGRTSLAWGAQRGHKAIVNLLLAQPGTDVNLGEPLSRAADGGYTEIVRLLLAQPGIDVNLGVPLVQAVDGGHTKVVELLLAQPGININLCSSLGGAVRDGYTEIVKLLLAQPGIDVHHGAPLYHAVDTGNMEMVELLLAQPGIDVNFETPLSTAASIGHMGIVELLLAQPNIDVNLGGPLSEALSEAHLEIAELLLAKPDIDVNHRVPLHYSAREGHTEIVRLLLAQPGVDVNWWEPLASAAGSGHKEIVELLLAHPDIDINLGAPLSEAASSGHMEIVKLLLAQPGIDVNFREPLLWALVEGHTEIVKLLLAQPGVDANLEELLLEAVRYGHTEIVELLLDQPGINMNLVRNITLDSCSGKKD